MIYIILLIIIIIIMLIIYYDNHDYNNNNIVFNNEIYKVYGITFGGGGQNYIDAGNRLINQMNKTNLFNRTILYTDDYLKNDVLFWTQHSKFINNNKKGYGYWLWKPYIILKTMEMLKDGDIIMYIDSGCEIDSNNSINIKKYFNYVVNDYIIMTSTYLTEKEWNKMDLILKLNMNEDKYLNTFQYQAGILLIYVYNTTRKLINEWYNIACDYHMIDDSPSINKNLNKFIEHRHDQSIFSLLIKKYNLDNKKSLINLVHVIKNRSGKSKMNDISTYFIDLLNRLFRLYKVML